MVNGKFGRQNADAPGTRPRPHRRLFQAPLLHLFKHKRSFPTSKRENMPVLSSVLPTRSRDYKANVPPWKIPRLPATDPSSFLLKLNWSRHRMIWISSLRAGRSCRRKLRVCPVDDRDEIALPSKRGGMASLHGGPIRPQPRWASSVLRRGENAQERETLHPPLWRRRRIAALPQRVPLIQFCERLVLHRRCDE